MWWCCPWCSSRSQGHERRPAWRSCPEAEHVCRMGSHWRDPIWRVTVGWRVSKGDAYRVTRRSGGRGIPRPNRTPLHQRRRQLGEGATHLSANHHAPRRASRSLASAASLGLGASHPQGCSRHYGSVLNTVLLSRNSTISKPSAGSRTHAPSSLYRVNTCTSTSVFSISLIWA